MRNWRILFLGTLWAIPLTWSATATADSRNEIVNQALASLLLGTLPLVSAMLLWQDQLATEDPLVRYGKSRRDHTARALLGVCGSMGCFALLTATVALLVYRGPSDALLFHDLSATLPVALAGALGVTTTLAFGRLWLGRVGLVTMLILAWLLGSADLPIAAFVPTGHVRHLLGVGAELPFSPWISFACLYGMTILFSAATLARVPR